MAWRPVTALTASIIRGKPLVNLACVLLYHDGEKRLAVAGVLHCHYVYVSGKNK